MKLPSLGVSCGLLIIKSEWSSGNAVEKNVLFLYFLNNDLVALINSGIVQNSNFINFSV